MSNKISTALVGSAAKQATIKDLLERSKGSLAAVLPKHLTPERLLKVALSATARDAKLLACTPKSLLLAVMQAAELGLEAGGLMGTAYLVPYKDEAKLIIGYKGMIQLARNSGDISSIEARVVHANDVFELEYGLQSKLVHRPSMSEPGPMVAVYSIVRFKDGGYHVECMSKVDVDAIRDRSPSGKDGPWVTDYEEMAKKTVLKRALKLAPLSAEKTTFSKALEHEVSIDSNAASPLVDGEVFETVTEDGVVLDRGAQLAAELTNGAQS